MPWSLTDFNYNQSPTDFFNNPYASPSPGGVAAPSAFAGSGGSAGGGFGGAGLAIGAGLGLLASIGQEKAYQAMMHQKAVTTRYSPWTHMDMAQPTPYSGLGTVLGYGASGAALGQAMGGNSNNNLPLMAMMMGGS